MFAISSICLLLIVSLCHSQSIKRECEPDTIDFATKVQNSSVVVYGKAMAKTMNDGSDSTFHVFYQVDCVLKGPATLRQINITNAGRASGKKYCQEFPVGTGYSIAFLEPISPNETDHKSFTPADFVEILDEGNSTSQLLARTCNLHRLVPRQSIASVTDVCPPVAVHPICLEHFNATLIPSTSLHSNSTDINLPDGKKDILNKTLHDSNDKQLKNASQQELEAIRGKSGTVQVDADNHNGAQLITFNIILIIMAIFFSSK
jgi:hypothetical protein